MPRHGPRLRGRGHQRGPRVGGVCRRFRPGRGVGCPTGRDGPFAVMQAPSAGPAPRTAGLFWWGRGGVAGLRARSGPGGGWVKETGKVRRATGPVRAAGRAPGEASAAGRNNLLIRLFRHWLNCGGKPTGVFCGKRGGECHKSVDLRRDAAKANRPNDALGPITIDSPGYNNALYSLCYSHNYR